MSASELEYCLLALARENKRFIVAHRGASGVAPENTISSLRSAIDAGAAMVEVDVQLTKDHQVIMLHDPYLGRTTSGSGKVRSYSYNELQSLDAGSWFDQSFSGEKIPLLKQGLEMLQENKICVNIEIKPPSESEDYTERVSAILETVASLSMLNVTLFSSFHHASLAHIKKEYPGSFTAAINIPGDTRLPSVIANEIGCDAFVCSLRELTHKRDDDAQKHNLLLGVYTINSQEDFNKIMKYSAPAIVTNFPSRISAMLHNYPHSHSSE